MTSERVSPVGQYPLILDGDRDGETYDPVVDRYRLNKQMRAVWLVAKDGLPRTPEQWEEATGYGWASVGARLRDFRKPRFGGFQVVRTSLGAGLFTYQLKVRA